MNDKVPYADPNSIKSESCSDHCNINNTVVSKKIFITEDRQFNYSNSTGSRSKCLGNNAINNNRNVGNRLSNKNLWLNNYEDSE